MNNSHADAGDHGAPDVGDDRLDAPSVTPVPAPPDDQLMRLAGAGALAAAILTLAGAWWLRRNIAITRR